MSCIHCGATLAYNVYTGHYFAIAYAKHLTVDDYCASHHHVPSN